MKSAFDLTAPAKLNLFLHINHRKNNGYHALQSVFMLIDWVDTLHIDTRRDGKITRQDLTEALPEIDLIVRAARLLQHATHTTQGANISVTKTIPSQAGMGGGSSDAATCLLALNRLWQLNLTAADLCRIGLELGADVPFFIHCTHHATGSAWVQGMGDDTCTLPPSMGDAFAGVDYWVAKPDQGVSTPLIFQHPQLKRSTPEIQASKFWQDQTHIDWWNFGHNDLQPIAEQLCPAITQTLLLWSEKNVFGRMTGSGSAVFAPRLSKEIGLEQLQTNGTHTKICKHLPCHPFAQSWF